MNLKIDNSMAVENRIKRKEYGNKCIKKGGRKRWEKEWLG